MDSEKSPEQTIVELHASMRKVTRPIMAVADRICNDIRNAGFEALRRGTRAVVSSFRACVEQRK